MQREFNPNDLQKALLQYEATDLETSMIDWAREHWPMAARGMIYAKKEAEDTVSGVQGVRDAEHAIEMAERVRLGFAVPFRLRDAEIPTATSIGVALQLVPHSGSSSPYGGLGLIALFSGVFISMGFLWSVIGE